MWDAGSHTVLALLEHGYSVTIIDNLDNSFLEAFKRMQELAGDKADKLKFVQVSCWFSLRTCVLCAQYFATSFGPDGLWISSMPDRGLAN